MLGSEIFALLSIKDLAEDLIKVFQHGPGYKKSKLVGGSDHGKCNSTAFVSISGEGLLHCTIVEETIGRMKYYINTYLAIK